MLLKSSKGVRPGQLDSRSRSHLRCLLRSRCTLCTLCTPCPRPACMRDVPHTVQGTANVAEQPQRPQQGSGQRDDAWWWWVGGWGGGVGWVGWAGSQEEMHHIKLLGTAADKWMPPTARGAEWTTHQRRGRAKRCPRASEPRQHSSTHAAACSPSPYSRMVRVGYRRMSTTAQQEGGGGASRAAGRMAGGVGREGCCGCSAVQKKQSLEVASFHRWQALHAARGPRLQKGNLPTTPAGQAAAKNNPPVMALTAALAPRAEGVKPNQRAAGKEAGAHEWTESWRRRGTRATTTPHRRRPPGPPP